MGVATDYVKSLREHPLTLAEEQEQTEAEEIGHPDAEVTLDGDVVRPQPMAAPKVIAKRQTATWD